MAKVIIVKAERNCLVWRMFLVVDYADVPASPIKPNKKTNVAIGGILGIMVGAGIIFLIEFLTTPLKMQRMCRNI